MLATNITDKIIHASIYNCRDDRIDNRTNRLKGNIGIEEVLEWHNTVQQFNTIMQDVRPSIPCG